MALSSLHRCSLGGNSFQMQDFAFTSKARRGANGMRAGTDITITGRGFIEATDETDYAAKIAEALAAFNVSGQAVTIYGINDTPIMALLPTQSLDGGPHVTLAMAEGTTSPALVRYFTFTIETNQPDNTIPLQQYEVVVNTAAEGLLGVAWTGTVTGVPAQNKFNALLATFRSTYPLPNWVVTHDFTQNSMGSEGKFTLRAKQMYTPLPAGAVDGELTTRKEVDEHGLSRIVVSGDFVATAGAQQIFDAARPIGFIFRESFEYTIHQSPRVRFTIETISGVDTPGLTYFSQIFTVDGKGDIWEEHQYPGVKPCLVRKPEGYAIVRQVGTIRATQPVKAIDPYWPDALAEKPQVTSGQLDRIQWQVSWAYVMYVDLSTYMVGLAPVEIDRPEVLSRWE